MTKRLLTWLLLASLSCSAFAATIVVKGPVRHAAAGGGSIAFVQDNNCVIDATPDTCALTSVTAGNLVVVSISLYMCSEEDPFPTPADSNGTVAVAIRPTAGAFFADRFLSAIYYVQNANAGTHTITSTPDGLGCNDGFINISEFSGLSTTAALDVTASALVETEDVETIGSGTTATTATANELLVVNLVVANGDGVADANITTPAGFTPLFVQDNTATTVGMQNSYRIISSTGAQSTSWAWDSGGAGNNAQGVIATFK